MALLKNN